MVETVRPGFFEAAGAAALMPAAARLDGVTCGWSNGALLPIGMLKVGAGAGG